MDLHRGVRAEHGGLGGEQFGGGGLQGETFPGGLGAFLGHGGVVDHQPRGFDARLHVGDLETRALKFPDLLAEGLAFARIRDAGFVGRFGDTQRLRADADASHIQDGHGDFESFTLFAKTVGDWDFAILKNQFAGG